MTIALICLAVVALCAVVFAVVAASDDIERVFDELPENDDE